MRKKVLAFILIISTYGPIVWGLQIPLSGGAENSNGGAKIGFVDMDRIFQIYPQTQAAKEDYAKQLKKKKEQLATKEKELAEIKNRISVLESTLGGATASEQSAISPAEPTTEISNPENKSASLPSMKTDLENKKTEYEELRKQAASDLANFQSQQSQIILGKIYQALRDLALEEQVSVVVDKTSILYGDAAIDLTDKLQQKVRGY